MQPSTKLSRMYPFAIKYLTTVIFIAVFGQSVRATTFSIFYDFDTDAAIFESWRHSPLVPAPPDIHLGGLLYYVPVGFSDRGLGFSEGFLVDAYAFLEYQVIPVGATATSGSVGFLLGAPTGTGAIELWGSEDGISWIFLDVAQASSGFMQFDLSIGAGNPAQFLSLRGTGQVVMDNLNINVSYVPLPASMIFLVCALGVLFPLRKSAG